MLKINFENQILALFDVYFWPLNKSHEKINIIFVISAIIASIWNVFIKFCRHDEKLTQAAVCLYDIVKEEIVFDQSYAVPTLFANENDTLSTEKIHAKIGREIVNPLIKFLNDCCAAIVMFRPREVMNCLVKLAKAADLEMVLYARFELISDLRWIFDSKPDKIPKTLIQQSWQKQISHILYNNSQKEVQQNQVYHLG